MGKRKSGGLLSTSNPQLNSFEDSPDHGKQIKTDRKKEGPGEKEKCLGRKEKGLGGKKMKAQATQIFVVVIQMMAARVKVS
ncbi:MAG TPA: hypothetical protein VGO47_09725 [Chlamydiales bacterium]|nr:hypothetical protein [Chlamydiales bacterium]